ncbi:MAG: hypothetical protein R3E12_17080 [Candidatus Eisenbacteria bacterium]|uniref:Shikimate dehydrogenase substrate binding N-terminal domain-containing protein n=1 Tax=Eiseniibacteriota bacterium TaxID=2212470 RepID=A0A956RR12_UNCEI|nr:hypothetical protein [Candidatus Eisenbacteria bacterium]
MKTRREPPDGRTRLLGIVGDPLAHSRSPSLHSAVLRALDRNLLYVPVPVSNARLRRFVEMARDLGFVGFNVTTPYKERVYRWIEPLDRETQRTRMVNTVLVGRGRPRGTGTDGAGVVRWLERSGLTRSPIGVLGFGPAARSIVHRCWQDGLPIASVWTRRPRAVARMLADWRHHARDLPGNGPSVCDWKQVAGSGGALPAAQVHGVRTWVSTLPPEAILPMAFWRTMRSDAVVLDLNYGDGRDRICRAARRHGKPASDGLGPLLEQAALSLSLWLEEEVPVGAFRRAAGVRSADLRPR